MDPRGKPLSSPVFSLVREQIRPRRGGPDGRHKRRADSTDTRCRIDEGAYKRRSTLMVNVLRIAFDPRPVIGRTECQELNVRTNITP